ncbi:MAG: acyltransferase, partial [Bdellovibrionales bacterium]|nr:acyltransferase [Bdellovibrionales bacterium]
MDSLRPSEPQKHGTGNQRVVFVDFLRGLSVLGILFYHLVPGIPVGLGQGSMEFFFVISGYLVTKTLSARMALGAGGLKEFALSRAKRLLPTLCLYLVIVASVNLMRNESVALVGQSSFWTITGFYNWFQIVSPKTLPGLGGIWSLAIEDQYYYSMLLAGSVFIALRMRHFSVAFLVFYLLLALSSLGMRIHNAGPVAYSLLWVSYNTISRLWGFCCGGIVAALLSPPFRKSGSPKAKYSRDLGAIVLLLAACASLFGVKEYN